MWWFCWCSRHRPRPGRDGKQSVKQMTHGWLMAKQQVPNFKQLLMLGYLTGNLNQDIMCQQTACTLTLKETPHVSWIRSPPGLEVIITNFASKQRQQCDCLVHAQGISQGLKKKIGVSIAFMMNFGGPKERFEAMPHSHSMQLLQFDIEYITYNNLKLGGPRAFRTAWNPCRSPVPSIEYLFLDTRKSEKNKLPTTIDLSTRLVPNS